MKKQKGFTLIELLVVIAIIGILSSVVLASLNTARDKGANAAIKSNLANIRAQAEIVYDTAGNYDGVCTNATVINAVNAAKQASGVTAATNVTFATAGTGVTATCHVPATPAGTWAVEVPLKGSTVGAPLMQCVDSSGQSTTTATVLGASDAVCG